MPLQGGATQDPRHPFPPGTGGPGVLMPANPSVRPGNTSPPGDRVLTDKTLVP